MRKKRPLFLASCSFFGLLAIAVSVHAQNADQATKAKTAQPTKAAKQAPAYDASVPKPTHAGVSYGKHKRHILDFWKASSDKPTPLVFVIHGGGWSGGSKERLHRFADTAALLESGISVVAINYRLMADTEGVVPPVKAPLHDAARALQFVRSKASEWNIDKARIGAAGGSAGACSSLWLTYHDDLADPKSEDLVARESTRLWCAAVIGPQTTLDPKQMKEWTPNSRYGGHAFGKKNFAKFLADRESILSWIEEYSPYALVSDGDPPTCLFFNAVPAIGKAQKDPTHTANFGVKLQERCVELGVDCKVIYPGVSNASYQTPTDYLIATLKKRSRDSRK
ncbi:MAG: acetyl esterase/lipase [Mariniblastus sp.]|jgi:acetyl esterase/lipase